MNFGEMQAEVRRRLDEASANYWSDDDIKLALNEGYRAMSDASEWNECVYTVYLTAQTYYDLRSIAMSYGYWADYTGLYEPDYQTVYGHLFRFTESWESDYDSYPGSLRASNHTYDWEEEYQADVPRFDVISPKRIRNTQTGQWLYYVDVRDLDYHTTRNWETVTGEPQKAFLRGLWWLGLYPHPSTDTGTFKIFFTSIPADLGNDEDAPGFPREFHFGIVEYALYDLLVQDAEVEKGLRHWAEYLVKENELTKFVQRRMSLDRVGGYV